MKIVPTKFEGLYILEPAIHRDERGYFLESYREEELPGTETQARFVQDNLSFSNRNVVRGLHYQAGRAAQQKLVMVCRGEILDVAVDLRKDSPTFGRHLSVRLDGRDHRMVLIPAGFAHGFSVLSQDAVVCYKCSSYYSREMERGIRWNDPQLDIDWQVDIPVVSEKDRAQPLLSQVAGEDLF